MNPIDSLKLIRSEVGVSTKVPYTHLNKPTIFETQQGHVGTVLALSGIPFETEKNSTLNQCKRIWHKSLTILDEQFCVYVTLHRHKQDIQLEGDFSNKFAEDLNRDYHARFKNKSMYLNDIYITVIYKGITTGKVGKGISLFNKISDKAIKEAREAKRQAQIKLLEEKTYQLCTSLSQFSPYILGTDDNKVGHSELLAFLSLTLNAGDKVTLKSPQSFPLIAKGIKHALQLIKKYPDGHLAQYLTRKRIFFGNYIQFQGSCADDVQYGSILSIKHYGSGSGSIMLDPLLHLDSEFITTHSFALEAKDISLSLINRQTVKLNNSNDAAKSQIDELEDLKDMVASGKIKMGYHHHGLLLLSDNKNNLEIQITRAIKCYQDADIVAIRETLGPEPVFWSLLPGNLNQIARSCLITSDNFVDFCPLHNYRTGYKDGNHLGSAVTILETPSKTPYFFNYHVKGSQDNPSKGHTSIIGGNNSGKTVLMGFLDSQAARYNSASFIFDRDRGMEIYVRASDGHYSILSPNYPKDSQFNPLQLEDTPVNRQFCRDWLCQLVKNEGENNLEGEIVETLKKCIDYAYDYLKPQDRTLTHATKIIPANFQKWVNLRRWLRGDDNYPDGEYAYLFDNHEDHLSLHKKMGFDMTHFLDKEPPQVLTAILMYFFHRIELIQDGSIDLISIILDEAWQYLRDPYWAAKLERWLPTLRKKKYNLVLATQSPNTVINSPIKHVILDNIATSIYFANPHADESIYMDGFNLSRSEFETIKENDPSSRLFLLKQDHESVLCRLDLSNMPDALAVFSGNSKTIALLDKLRQEFGGSSNDWLPEFYKSRRSL